MEKPKRIVNTTLLQSMRWMACVACGKTPCEASHIRSRGSGGPDTSWNVVPKCRACHREWHASGVTAFLRAHPKVAQLLIKMGWELVQMPGPDGLLKLRHPSEAST